MDIRWLMVLTENDALVDPRDLRGLVDLAVTAEANGVDGVMLSEHVLLGRDSGAAGRMANPRDYAAPGNQPPSYAWPSSCVAALHGQPLLGLCFEVIVQRQRVPTSFGHSNDPISL